MRYFKKMVGTKCYLSPINLDDAEHFTKWLNDPEVANNLRATPDNISLSHEKKILEKLADDHRYAIVEIESDRLLGWAGLKDVDYVHRHCLFVVFIGEAEDRGKGYGSEAVRLLLEHAFDYLNMHNVGLWVFEYNTPAIACYKSIGFREVGRRRHALMRFGKFHDVILMDMLEDEFRQNVQPRMRASEST